jgi:hypothetical protein
MKLIYTHENIMILHSAKNILALNGISSFVKNEHAIPNGARHGITNIFLELWINDDSDFGNAKEIIENEVENPVHKESWQCSECGEGNDGSFELCWKCQTVPAGTEH